MLQQMKQHWIGLEQRSVDVNIKGSDTVSITDLGFTILKKLRDSSTFRCDLPDGNRLSISNMIYNLLFPSLIKYKKYVFSTDNSNTRKQPKSAH